MVLRFRIAFLIAAVALLGHSILMFLDILRPFWGIEVAFALEIPWGIALLLVWVVLEGLHTWVRVKSSALQCPHCDHSLRGLKCPECGERLDSADQPP